MKTNSEVVSVCGSRRSLVMETHIARVEGRAAVCDECRTSPGSAEVDVEDQAMIEEILVDVAAALEIRAWQTECSDIWCS